MPATRQVRQSANGDGKIGCPVPPGTAGQRLARAVLKAGATLAAAPRPAGGHLSDRYPADQSPHCWRATSSTSTGASTPGS